MEQRVRSRIKESLISEPTAILAKEKGFQNGSYNVVIVNKDKSVELMHDYYTVNNMLGCDFSNNAFTAHERPSQSVLKKWFEIVHNIDIWAQPFVYKNTLPDETYSYKIYKDGAFISDGTDFLDEEDALEHAFIEAFKLI